MRFVDLALGLIALLGVVAIAALLAGGRPYFVLIAILLLAVGTIVWRLKRVRASQKNQPSPHDSA